MIAVGARLLAGLAVLAGDGARVADVYAAGDEATFVIEAAGRRIGEHGWRYAGETDLLGTKAHRFEGALRIETATALGRLEQRAVGELWTDERGRPLRVVMHGEAGGTSHSVELAFAGGRAVGTIGRGPSTQPIEVAVPADAFVLANNWIGMIELVGALAPPAKDAPRSLVLFSVDAATTLPYELRHQGEFAGKAGDESVEGEKYRDSLGEVLKVGRDGKLFEIEIPAGAVRIRRTDEPFPELDVERAPPRRADLAREEVVIEHDGGGVDGAGGPVRIAGTVARRHGASGRLPAVFFVSGSGGQDREGIAGGIDLGTHELLDHLTEAGFLTLRVDDRGVGRSSGPTAGLTFDDLIADARACVDFLRGRADVDPARLFVIGHSEGGETAPVLACERPLAGIVLMAAPGRSLFEILREQKRQALEAAGLPPGMVESELEAHREALELLTREGDGDASELRFDYRPEWANRAWYRSHARRDVIAQIRRVTCPVLIVQGGKDLQVSAERDAPALERALRDAGNRDVTLKVLPGLDHLFKKVQGQKPSFQEYFTARPVDREFLDLLVAWLRGRSGGNR